MAKITMSGFGEVEAQLNKLLSRGMARQVVEAGARAAVEEMRRDITAAGHVRTSSMLENVGPGEFHEDLDGCRVNGYPQGNDGKGVPNALKAFVINYGRGRRRTARTGDKFITGNMDRTEEVVQAAMQAESDRILAQINK